MDRDLRKRLFDEIKGYIEANSTRLAEREVAHRASTYYDPAYLARERALFLRQPLVVGHQSSLAAPGDFIAHADSGVPILVVRQADGGLKAFLNVCRHRGARVCTASAGNQARFSCPYHGWTYRNDGELLAAPKPGFPNLDVAAHGLVELPVEERHGLIWAVMTPGAPIDVAAHLGAVDAELSAYPLAGFVLERQELFEEAINWKFVLDGFLEVYHFPTLHQKSIAPYFHGKYSPFDSLGRHSRLVGVRKSFDHVREAELYEAELLQHIAVNYQIFPNSIFVWQGDHFELWSVYPGRAPGQCTVRIQSLVPPEMAGERWKNRWDRNWKVLVDTVQTEDWAISRDVQAALPYVGGGHVLFGRNEPGLQHFHHALDEALNELGL
jgi:phenylpropionate dioxygenase-like ring-hydroxylating dioxygenase large terminal subunit